MYQNKNAQIYPVMSGRCSAQSEAGPSAINRSKVPPPRITQAKWRPLSARSAYCEVRKCAHLQFGMHLCCQSCWSQSMFLLSFVLVSSSNSLVKFVKVIVTCSQKSLSLFMLRGQRITQDVCLSSLYLNYCLLLLNTLLIQSMYDMSSLLVSRPTPIVYKCYILLSL